MTHSTSPTRVVVAALLSLLVFLATGVQKATAATTWVVDDLPQLDCPGADYSSIQAAISAPTTLPGDTIQVCRGTYGENVILFKRLTLLGAQAGVDARGRVSTNESIVAFPTGTLLRLLTGSADSIIDGFTFLGGARGIDSDTGPIDRLQILNNRIHGFTATGIFLDDTGINITADQNDINGAAKVGGGGLVHLDQDNFDGFWFTNNNVVNGPAATGFFVDGIRNVDRSTPGARAPLFSRNFIDNNVTGVNLGGRAWGDGRITSNLISNNRGDGLQGGPIRARIEDNWFDRNGGNGLALTSFGNTTDPARGAQHNTIELNCFTRNGFSPPPTSGAGILFSATQFPGTISTNRANRNNIIGNEMGARYPSPGPETINAEDNWWRAADGPGPPDGTGSGDGVDGHGQIDFTPWRTTAVPGTPCGEGPATTLVLDPFAATNPVGTQHCVTATVTNAFGIPQPGVTVRFTVTGPGNTTGTAVTDANGEAMFCYIGPPLPGDDAITAIADADDDGSFEIGEPTGAATKTWILPATTPGCEIIITNGGWIIAMNGDRANFGGNAKADGEGNASGNEEYQDKGPATPFNLHGNVLVVVCDPDPTKATIFGEATIDGEGSFDFRIDVRDLGEPGKDVDKYRMQVEGGYDSGEQTLQGGNVQIHKD
jgi:hypothetical protein